MATVLQLDAQDVAKLHKAIKDYKGDAETTINDVLHNEASLLAQDAIRWRIPVSNAVWEGKKQHARLAKSLRAINGNLSVTVTTTKNYQYLYFPDDGTNTRRHVGNKQFFAKGGESVKDEIIQRCINKLTTNFEKGV